MTRRNSTAGKRSGKPDMEDIIARARERIEFPPVGMRFNYQDDVDTLVIRFDEAISPSLVPTDFEEGVIGIYQGRKLIGVELLDITGNLENANPR